MTYDAHNLYFLTGFGTPADSFAKGVLVREKGGGKHIVNDHDGRRLLSVLLAEEPAPEQGNLHNAQVAGLHPIDQGPVLLAIATRLRLTCQPEHHVIFSAHWRGAILE